MKNLSIAVKIWMSIIFVIGGYIATVLLAFFITQSTSRVITYIDEEARPFSEECTQLLYDFFSINSAYETAALIGEMNYFEDAGRLRKKIETLLYRMKDLEGLPSDLLAETTALDEALSILLSDQYATYMELAQLADSPSDELLLRLAGVNDRKQAMEERLLSQRENAKEHLRKEVHRLQAATTLKSRIDIIVFVIVMLISLPLITLAINTYTLNPLRSLIRFVRGEITMIPENLPKDEIGELAQSFLEFTHTQQENTTRLENEVEARTQAEQNLMAHQENLENIIEERTHSIHEANLQLESRKEELQKSEIRFRTVFSSMHEGLCLHDAIRDGVGEVADYRLILANPAFETITGISCGKAIDAIASELYQTQPAPFLDVYAKVLNTGEPVVFECYLEGQRKHLLVSASKSSANQFVTIFSDISEQKKIEGELQQAQKLESVGQLAAGIAHEINTPIQFVGDNIQFMKSAFEDLLGLQDSTVALIEQAKTCGLNPELIKQVENERDEADIDYLIDEIPRAVEQSLEGVQRVTTIVLAMKEFAHPGSKEMQFINLNKAIDTTIVVARNEWKYAAELKTDFCDTLPAVPCLPGEINQVVLNLIVNARDAIVDRVGSEERLGLITISTSHTESMVRVEVTDNGGGIPKHVQERIFDPFFTTKEVGRGSGQGLAIARGVIVNKHQGELSFITEEGVGTTFVILLPLNAPPKAA
jgi:signal transduction histidine kinase/HAMP domain-containing protein